MIKESATRKAGGFPQCAAAKPRAAQSPDLPRWLTLPSIANITGFLTESFNQ
jgi:hypothetical protein